MDAHRAFNPDLILLSAGFDGGGVDQGNVKLADETRPNGLDLEESDFAWLTSAVLGALPASSLFNQNSSLFNRSPSVNHQSLNCTCGVRALAALCCVRLLNLLRVRVHCGGWLIGVAKVCCEGRVVSVLEGGYGTQVHDHKTKKWTFNRDQFANNVAAHVKALMAG